MLLRSLTALAGLLILLGALWAGLPWVFLLTALAAVLGLREFYRMHPPPAATPVLRQAQDERGDVAAPDATVEDVAGGVAVENSASGTMVDDVAGGVAVESSAPGTVAEDVAGGVAVEGSAPGATADDVAGGVVEGSAPGATVEDVAGGVVEGSAPGTMAENVAGGVAVEGSAPGAMAEDVAGGVAVEGSAPGTMAEDVAGGEADKGDAHGELVEPPHPHPITQETPHPAQGEPAQSTPLPFFLGALWVIAFIIGGAAANGPLHFAGISLGILVGGAFGGLLWLIAFYRGENWPVAAAYLVVGPLYLGWLLAHVLLLVQVGDNYPGGDLGSYVGGDLSRGDGYELGRNWLLLALLTTFATDTGAYLVGRAIGRHPMAPSISPNKTWEGAIGGFVGAVAAALLMGQFFNLGLSPTAWNWQLPLIGATVGIAAQAGDLLESRLKRLAQVKDAGNLMPGHGGLLDRLDSLLLTIPVVYYLVILLPG